MSLGHHDCEAFFLVVLLDLVCGKLVTLAVNCGLLWSSGVYTFSSDVCEMCAGTVGVGSGYFPLWDLGHRADLTLVVLLVDSLYHLSCGILVATAVESRPPGNLGQLPLTS